jgi:serine/threonine protein kinase
MAPEVFEEKYSWSADIWSIGCVAVQMATGSPPWKSLGYSNPVALFNHIKGSSGPPAFEMAEDALSKDMSVSHKQFQNLLRKCFDRNPESRPSAEVLLRDGFFIQGTPWADDERSNARSLFSPASSCSVGMTPQRSAITPKKHSVEQRNSIGPSLSSPLLSPPLSTRANGRDCTQSLPTSPPADTTDWPSWARNKGQQDENGRPYEALKTVDQITGSFDSLALSESPKTKSSLLAVSSNGSNYDSRSPLHGLRLVSCNRTVENKGT